MKRLNIEAELQNISSIRIPKLQAGEQKTIENFYFNCIEPTLPSVSVVEEWQHLLVKYASSKDAIFFLRRNASAPNNDWLKIRRGFLTEYHDAGYVFCDNFYAHYIFAMALDDYVPTYEEFKRAISERVFPYGFMVTKEEIPLQAYRKGSAPGINSAGWKLAHLYSVNDRDYSFDYRSIIESTFPRGEREEWTISPKGNYKSRYINRPMLDLERAILRAHFLRLSSPLNYFLVPKTKNETDALGGNIGECRVLLKYVYAQFSKRYGSLMSEYSDLIYDAAGYRGVDIQSLGQTRIDIRYSPYGLPNVMEGKKQMSEPQIILSSKPKVGRVSKSNSSVSKNQLHEMARLYLEKSVSFRNLERQVLGIDSAARGGGFIAKTALNNFGITAANKGALRYRTVQTEIDAATGAYRNALIEIYG